MDPARRIKRVDVIATALVALIAGTLLITALFHQDSGVDGMRSPCSENIRQTILACTMYAQNNNTFPIVRPPPHANNFANAPDPHMIKRLPAITPLVRHYFGKKAAQRGSPTACLWLLVMNQQLTPKNFICPNDPYTKRPAALYETGVYPKYFDNFGESPRGRPRRGFAESYSIACPWYHEKTAPWWTGNGAAGSDVPLMADMAPAISQPGVSHANSHYRNPGLPYEKKLSGYVMPNVWNTGNHRGKGENVGFGDDHVTWHENPFCGDNGDNIYTTNPGPKFVKGQRTNSVHVVGRTARIAKSWRAGKAHHFDTVMLPVQKISDLSQDQGF